MQPDYADIRNYEKITEYFHGEITSFHDDYISEFNVNGTEIDFVIAATGGDTKVWDKVDPVDVRIKCHDVVDWSFDKMDIATLCFMEFYSNSTEDGYIELMFDGIGGFVKCKTAEAFVEIPNPDICSFADIEGHEQIHEKLNMYPILRGAEIKHFPGKIDSYITVSFKSKDKKKHEIRIDYKNERLLCDHDSNPKFSKFFINEIRTNCTKDGWVNIELKGTGYTIRCTEPKISSVE